MTALTPMTLLKLQPDLPGTQDNGKCACHRANDCPQQPRVHTSNVTAIAPIGYSTPEPPARSGRRGWLCSVGDAHRGACLDHAKVDEVVADAAGEFAAMGVVGGH